MPNNDINITAVYQDNVKGSSGCGKPSNDSGAVSVLCGGIAFSFIAKKEK